MSEIPTVKIGIFYMYNIIISLITVDKNKKVKAQHLYSATSGNCSCSRAVVTV